MKQDLKLNQRNREELRKNRESGCAIEEFGIIGSATYIPVH